MATLTVTNTYIAGTLAKASEVNQNFTDILNWAAGNIENDNLGTMSGTISFNIVTGVKALDITNAGNEGTIEIAQNAALNPNKSSFKLAHAAADTAGDAGVFLEFASASSTIPVMRIDNAGTGASLQFRDGTSEKMSIKMAAGEIQYDATTGNEHSFRVNAVEEFAISGSGVAFGSAIATVDINTLNIESGGPQITKSGSSMLLNSALLLGDASGPSLEKDGSNELLVKNAIQLEDTDGPVISKRSNGVLGVEKIGFETGTTAKAMLNTGAGERTVYVQNHSATTNLPIVVSAQPSSEGLVIVRGQIDSTGTKLSGEGFTSSKLATGSYEIIYSPASVFLEAAVVTATAISTSTPYICVIDAQSSAKFEVKIRNTSGAATDVDFYFIAIAQRGT